MTEGALVGVLIDGRYRVDDVVGSGGFGTVYGAFHVGLGARVALKVPRTDGTSPRLGADAIATFLEEGRTMKKLRHPSLVAALDVGLLPPDENGVALPYLVLEWCEGPTLKEWLAANPGPRSRAAVWALLRPAFEALAHAHAEGVVHRDLKPANILLEPSRAGGFVPKVIDFGIAKIVETTDAHVSDSTRTTSQERAFTPKYAAPEQLAAVRTGPWTDVYTLGLLMLELLSGRPVFATEDEARRSIVESNLPTPRKLGLDLGPWDRVIERALSPRPSDRYADAGAMMRALDGAPDDAAKVGALVRSVGRTRPSPGEGVRSTSGAPMADDSVVPSSRTTRTTSPSVSVTAPTSRRQVAIAAVAAVVLGTASVVAITRFDAIGQRFGAPTASASAETPAPPPLAGESIPPQARPLSTLTAKELVARASAGGMSNCTVLENPGLYVVTCGNGQTMLRDWKGGTTDNLAQIRRNAQYQAKTYGDIYGAARFTTDETWSLMVATKSVVVENVTKELLAGMRHGEIGTEKVPIPQGPIPPKLADWTGIEVAARVLSLGGAVTFEDVTAAMPSVHFMLDGEAGTTMFLEGQPEAWIKAMKGQTTPFSYAVDGNRALVCYGTGKTGTVAFMKSLLGTTTATKIERDR